MDFDTHLDSLPEETQKIIKDICEEAGTFDAEMDVLLAAANKITRLLAIEAAAKEVAKLVRVYDEGNCCIHCDWHLSNGHEHNCPVLVINPIGDAK